MSINVDDVDFDSITNWGNQTLKALDAHTHINDMDEQEANTVRKTMEVAASTFPYLALEAVKVGLARQDFINEKLNRHIDDIQSNEKDIALLLELNAALGGKEENTDLSQKAQDLIKQLKDRGIDLQSDTVGDIKRLTSSHESRLRSNITIQFKTKIEHLMTQIETLNQILQNIIRSDAKLKEKTLQRQ